MCRSLRGGDRSPFISRGGEEVPDRGWELASAGRGPDCSLERGALRAPGAERGPTPGAPGGGKRARRRDRASAPPLPAPGHSEVRVTRSIPSVPRREGPSVNSDHRRGGDWPARDRKCSTRRGLPSPRPPTRIPSQPLHFLADRPTLPQFPRPKSGANNRTLLLGPL